MLTPEAEEFLVQRLATELRRFRESRKLSQEEFAEKIGCSVRQLSDIENGLSTTSFLFLVALLALMKDETWWDFLSRFVPEARRVLGVEPLRLSATSLGAPPLPPNWGKSSADRIASTETSAK